MTSSTLATKRRSPTGDDTATAEFLTTEAARFADDQVNLLPRSEVNYIEPRLLPVSFRGRIQIGVFIFG